MGEYKQAYDFCPKCGTLARDGVCPHCGKLKGNSHTSHSVLFIITGIISVVFLGGICLYNYVGNVQVETILMSEENVAQDEDILTEEQLMEYEKQQEADLHKLQEVFLVDTQDERSPFVQSNLSTRDSTYEIEKYARHFYANGEKYSLEDYYNKKVSYKIENKVYDYFSDDYETMFALSIPALSGEIKNKDSLNERIFNLCTKYVNAYFLNNPDKSKEYSDFSECYVTYYDENIISVLVLDLLSCDKAVIENAMSINIDVQKGEVIPNSEIIHSYKNTIDVMLDNKEANDYSFEVSALGVDEVKQMLEDEKQNFVCYTKDGMIFGINYGECWNVLLATK